MFHTQKGSAFVSRTLSLLYPRRGYRHFSTHSAEFRRSLAEPKSTHKASHRYGKQTSFSDLEKMFGLNVELENKLSLLLPKRSASFLACHSSIVELLLPLGSFIEKLLMSSGVEFVSKYSDMISYLASSLFRSLLVLNRMEEADSLLRLLSSAKLTTGDAAQSLLYYFVFRANNTQNNRSSFPCSSFSMSNTKSNLTLQQSSSQILLFPHTKEDIACGEIFLNHTIRLLRWYCRNSGASRPSIYMATLAIRCLKGPSKMGIALLLYKNAILSHPNYKYDPDRVSILLDHSIDNHFYTLAFLLLEEISHFKPSVSETSNGEALKAASPPFLVDKNLLQWMLSQPTPPKCSILQSVWGDLPLGQIPMLQFRRLLQKLISLGRVHKACKEAEEREFLALLTVQLLRRISTFSPSLLALEDPQERDRFRKFVVDLLEASVLLRSPEMTACSIYRLNPKLLLQYDDQVLFDFWRRAALASQTFELALDVIPAPTTLSHIISAAAAVVENRTRVMELLSQKKATFSWFHLLFLLASSPVTYNLPATIHLNGSCANSKPTHNKSLYIDSSSSAKAPEMMISKLLSEAKELGYVTDALHWQIRLASCTGTPTMVWELLANPEVAATLPPSIESIEVIIPAIFSTAKSRPDLFLEKTLQYVNDILKEQILEAPGPLFALVLKTALIKELTALEESLVGISSFLGSSSHFEDSSAYLTVTDLAKACVRVADARERVSAWTQHF